MGYSTTDTYKMKREIVHISKKVSRGLSRPERKFNADMLYGIVASQSCLLTKISQRLQEDTKKRYTVDRLSDHLANTEINFQYKHLGYTNCHATRFGRLHLLP